MSRVLIGYFIRRTWKKPPHPGKTLFAESRRIYGTYVEASMALDELTIEQRLDQRFDYDIAEAWMHTDGEP